MHHGGLRGAILHSAGANFDHGLRRSNADKRRAVLMLLQDEEWGRWSDREIARQCAVGHPLVARLRAEHLEQIPDAPRIVERGGTLYPMKPRGGAKPAEPVPYAPTQPEAPPAPSHADDAGNVVVLGNRPSSAPLPYIELQLTQLSSKH